MKRRRGRRHSFHPSSFRVHPSVFILGFPPAARRSYNTSGNPSGPPPPCRATRGRTRRPDAGTRFMEWLSRILAGLYFVAPPAAAGLAAWRARKGPFDPAAGGKAAPRVLPSCIVRAVPRAGIVVTLPPAARRRVPFGHGGPTAPACP